MTRMLRWFVAPVTCLAVVGLLAAPAAARDRTRTLTARGAILRPAAEAISRTVSGAGACRALLTDPSGECGFVPSGHGDFGYTVEVGPRSDDVLVSRPWVIHVFRQSATNPDVWNAVLSTRPANGDPGPLYAQVTAKVADVTGDKNPELVLGYRSEGTGEILDMDIVGTAADGTPKVLAHDQYYKGSVDLTARGIVAYTPVYSKGDGNCCPRFEERDVVRFERGRFVVHRGPKVPTKRAHVPPGDLG